MWGLWHGFPFTSEFQTIMCIRITKVVHFNMNCAALSPVSDSVHLGWGLRISFLTSSQILLVWKHEGNHCFKKLKNWIKEAKIYFLPWPLLSLKILHGIIIKKNSQKNKLGRPSMYRFHFQLYWSLQFPNFYWCPHFETIPAFSLFPTSPGSMAGSAGFQS